MGRAYVCVKISEYPPPGFDTMMVFREELDFFFLGGGGRGKSDVKKHVCNEFTLPHDSQSIDNEKQ